MKAFELRVLRELADGPVIDTGRYRSGMVGHAFYTLLAAGLVETAPFTSKYERLVSLTAAGAATYESEMEAFS